MSPRVDAVDLMNFDDRKRFIIKPNTLIMNTEYFISVKASLIDSQQVFFEGTHIVRINPPPRNGLIRLNMV